MARPLFDNPPRLFPRKPQLFSKGKPSSDPTMVWGWASMSSVNGVPVVDYEGDHIAIGDLQKAAHEFMSDRRTGCALHMRSPDDGQPVKVGTVVESLCVTDSLCKALGTDFGGRRGWLIGMRIDDPDVRRAVAKGMLPAFSVGGVGTRFPM